MVAQGRKQAPEEMGTEERRRALVARREKPPQQRPPEKPKVVRVAQVQETETFWERLVRRLRQGAQEAEKLAAVGTGPTRVTLDELYAIGKEAVKGLFLGSVMVKGQPVELVIFAPAVRQTDKLRCSLDECARHDEPEKLAWV